MKDLTTLKLSELRVLYPTIITNSKAKFLEMIKGLDGSDTNIDGEQCTEQDENGDIISEDNSLQGLGVTLPTSPIIDDKDNSIVGGNLPGNDAESIAEARYIMQIRENIPEYIMQHLFKIQGCDCVADAYAAFRDTNFAMRRAFQQDLIKWYKELFKERIRPTSCSACWSRRISRFRKHLKTKIID